MKTKHIVQRCPFLPAASQDVWPTTVQLHTKPYSSREELETMIGHDYPADWTLSGAGTGHIHLSDWTLSVAATEKQRKKNIARVFRGEIYIG